jgi:hypothetical protein
MSFRGYEKFSLDYRPQRERERGHGLRFGAHATSHDLCLTNHQIPQLSHRFYGWENVMMASFGDGSWYDRNPNMKMGLAIKRALPWQRRRERKEKKKE